MKPGRRPRVVRVPPALRPGDRIGIVAPAGPVRKERLESGMAYLRGRGFDLLAGDHLFERRAYLAGDDAGRLGDLNRILADRSVKAVWFARGGYGSARIVEGVDFGPLATRPKALVGYSDSTVLHAAAFRAQRLVTYYGPNVSDLGDEESFDEASLWRALQGDESRGIEESLAGATVLRDGKEIARMYPARWFYRKHEDEATTEVAIRRGFAEDLYLVMPAFSVEEQSASMGIHVNPLVNWVWAGFGVLAIGTGVALLPETVFTFALASLPAGAATASMLLMALLLWPSTLLAQQTVPVTQKSALHKQIEGEILCTCGCRNAVGSCGMLNCPGHKSQEEKLVAYLADGKDHDQIIAAFVADFGSQAVLTAPLDRGFNRVAWAFPYLVGIAGLIAIVVSARRWSGTPTVAAAGDAGLDPTINARLDDELRDLD